MRYHVNRLLIYYSYQSNDTTLIGLVDDVHTPDNAQSVSKPSHVQPHAYLLHIGKDISGLYRHHPLI